MVIECAALSTGVALSMMRYAELESAQSADRETKLG